MKKFLSVLLMVAMLVSVCSVASALNYQQCTDNASTFETFEEAVVNGPAYMMEMFGGTYVADPCLDNYPAGTTYIYRSAKRFTSASAAYRKNTVIGVYTDTKFETKEDALAYITELGLVDIIEECKGAIILVTPIGASFALADQYAYYQMQTATCNLGGSATTAEGGRATTAFGAYCGGTTYRYLIGIDGGASFLCNFIASNFDYITRVAGMLLVGGYMERIRDVAGVVPTYMVNPTDRMVEKFTAANDTDSYGYIGDVEYYFNKELPLQKVYVAQDENADNAAYVHDAYYNMFVKAQRVPVVRKDLFDASTLYTNVNWNQAPYSLCERNAFFGGKTADGVIINEVHSTHFEYFANPETTTGWGSSAGEYIDTWWEILPEEVLDGTAPEHSVPFILGLHGMGDDPLQFADELGLITLAGKERVAIMAPYHLVQSNRGKEVLPPLVDYMLEKYPALDPSRVYATGYSMGGAATLNVVNGHAGMFAAAVPHAPAVFGTADSVEQNDVELPIMFTTATYDFCGFGGVTGFAGDYNPADPYDPEHIKDVLQSRINEYLRLDNMDTVEYDFDKYLRSGFKASQYEEKTINGEYRNYTWFLNNEDGVPMVGLNITDFLPHGLYPEFGKITWDFMKHYSRDLETGAIIYNAYVD